MRIKFGHVIYETDFVSCPGEDEGRFVTVKTSNGVYSIDCETNAGAKWLMHKMLTDGYFNATGVDYNNDQNDMDWFGYCIDKTEDQKVFNKWINGIK
jgi:hypothetical protein